MSDQQFKKFVTEEEVAEQKQRRQAEWERVRQPDDPKECPEEETRTLFEQLQANKDFKDKEFEAENKLRSSVKGLDNEEVQFLNFVSNRQMQLERERSKEEKSVIEEMKNAAVVKVEEKKTTDKSKVVPSSSSSGSGKKTQQDLLKGAIKRKSSTDTVADVDTKITKRAKESETEINANEMSERGDAKLMAGLQQTSNGVTMVAGILPGISGYNDDDSSTENSSNSSDSENDHIVVPRTVTQRVIQEMVQKIKENCT